MIERLIIVGVMVDLVLVLNLAIFAIAYAVAVLVSPRAPVDIRATGRDQLDALAELSDDIRSR